MRRAARGLAWVLAASYASGAGAGGVTQQAAMSQPRQGGFPSAPWGARIWFVDAAGIPPGSGTFAEPYTDLAAALATPALAPGDWVVVAPGSYPGPVLAPAFGVGVVSTQGAAVTVIDGQGLAPALRLAGTDGVPVYLEGFTLENGAGSAVPPIFSAGGGLQAVDARFELRSCVIRHNDAFWGGGVMSKDSVGVLRQCSIEENTNTGFGGRGAGVLADGGSLAIEGSSIRCNVSGDFFAPGNGGGIYAQGGVDLDVRDTLIELNVAELGGGGVYGPGDYLDCTLRANQGQFGGGANATSATSFTGCLIEANAADSLGGTSHFGGGVWGPATLGACTVRGNLAWGGVAGVDGGLLLSCAVEENLAVPGFGGVNNLSGGAARSLILDSTLSGNVADAGGLYLARGGGAAQSTLVDCDLEANEARPDPDAQGGGVHACDVRGSRLHDNVSSGAGGGAYGGTLFRCLIYDNQAEGGGGAADAMVDHCTLEGNQAAVGDGLWVGPDIQVALSNSILYGNGDEEIALDAGATAAVTFNDVLGGWPGPGNIDVDPLFVAPGPHDYNLGPNSPCIDKGDPAFAPDPDGSRTDMGALVGFSKHYTNAAQRGGFAAKP